MIRFREPTLPLKPYWPRITQIYYRDIQPQYVDRKPITIWGWLETEYGAQRSNLSEGPFLGWLRFERESMMTAFVLRFQ